MFYRFGQNNSGGYYLTNAEVGVGAYVVVEAGSVDEAEYRFDKVRGNYGAGFDSYCSCCGTRWDSVSWDGGHDTVAKAMEYYTCDERRQGFVHYADGTVVTVADAVDRENNVVNGEVVDYKMLTEGN